MVTAAAAAATAAAVAAAVVAAVAAACALGTRQTMSHMRYNRGGMQQAGQERSSVRACAHTWNTKRALPDAKNTRRPATCGEGGRPAGAATRFPIEIELSWSKFCICAQSEMAARAHVWSRSRRGMRVKVNRFGVQ